MRASEVIGGSREIQDVPCGTKAFLGFARSSRCRISGLAHAGYVGFCGCEIASTRNYVSDL